MRCTMSKRAVLHSVTLYACVQGTPWLDLFCGLDTRLVCSSESGIVLRGTRSERQLNKPSVSKGYSYSTKKERETGNKVEMGRVLHPPITRLASANHDPAGQDPLPNLGLFGQKVGHGTQQHTYPHHSKNDGIHPDIFSIPFLFVCLGPVTGPFFAIAHCLHDAEAFVCKIGAERHV